MEGREHENKDSEIAHKPCTWKAVDFTPCYGIRTFFYRNLSAGEHSPGEVRAIYAFALYHIMSTAGATIGTVVALAKGLESLLN